MLKILTTIMLFLSINSYAQFTGTNTPSHQHEATEQQKAADRIENAQREDALKPNSKSTPTKVDTSTWGIDPNLNFEITNHLFGYSTILESEQTLSGFKITGFMNFAYYNAKKKNSDNSNERSKSRYVFGIESPLANLTNRTVLWGGFGGTMGDAKGLYIDLGLDYILASWFKVQGGINYNSTGLVSPQISLGLVW